MVESRCGPNWANFSLRYSRNGSDVVVQHGLATPEGLAVDWIAGNLYWIDSNLDQIEVAKLNGEMRTTLIAGGMEHPRAIALDPGQGIIFWTDWDASFPRIEAASMSGGGRHVVFKDMEIGAWPNGLTLDHLERPLYDGTAVIEILRGHEYLSHPFAVSLFGGSVYWTDWRTNTLARANKWTGHNVTVIQKTSAQPFDLQIYHPSRQPEASNPCGANGGRGPCSHLCLIDYNRTAACSCPHLMKISPNNRSCVALKRFLLYVRRSEIRGVDIDNPYMNIMTALTVPDIDDVTVVDYDALDERIYWADVKTQTIKRAFINGTSLETVISGGKSDSPFHPHWHGLVALSHTEIISHKGNLYWTDHGLNLIEIARLNGMYRSVVISEGLDQPRAIAVHPQRGYGLKISVPSALAVDWIGKNLYWCDIERKSLEVSKSNGLYPTVLLIPHDHIQGVMGLTLFEDFIYWTDGKSKSLRRAHKTSGAHARFSLSIQFLKMIPPVPKHQCQVANGGCSHLCLLSPGGGHKCACPTNFYLAADNKTYEKTCGPHEFRCANNNCIPDHWRCDSQNDCGDNSDEENCSESSYSFCPIVNCPIVHCFSRAIMPFSHSEPVTCNHKDFACTNGDCISARFRCDGDYDCIDNSDEVSDQVEGVEITLLQPTLFLPITVEVGMPCFFGSPGKVQSTSKVLGSETSLCKKGSRFMLEKVKGNIHSKGFYR
uniref:EGF-like domain-containing protein n=1 Tax=Electrophorus electricus TaxID=8005 RepID=A0AAY5EZH7_ELEEL